MRKFQIIFCALLSVDLNAMELAQNLQGTSVDRSILAWGKKIFRKGVNAVTEHPYRAIGGVGIASAALGMIIYHMRSRRHVDTPSQNHEERGLQLRNTMPPNPPLNQIQQKSNQTTQEPKPTPQEPKPTPQEPKSRLHQIPQQNTLQQNENVQQILSNVNECDVDFSDQDSRRNFYQNIWKLSSVDTKEPLTVTISGDIPDNAFLKCINPAGKRDIHIVLEKTAKIGESAFATQERANNDKCNRITKIEIPSTVTHIGKSAFFNCGMESITLPNSVTVLDKLIFERCYNLHEVKLPDSLESLPDGCFAHCYNLEEIKLPDSVQSLGQSAFRGCRSLKNFNWPKNLHTIGGAAFYECFGLKDITISETVKKIGSLAFSSNDLSSLELPENFKYNSEGHAMLYNCAKLNRLTFFADDFRKIPTILGHSLPKLTEFCIKFKFENVLNKAALFFSNLYWKKNEEKFYSENYIQTYKSSIDKVGSKLESCFECPPKDQRTEKVFFINQRSNIFCDTPNKAPLNDVDFSRNIQNLSAAIFPKIDNETDNENNPQSYEQGIYNNLKSEISKIAKAFADEENKINNQFNNQTNLNIEIVKEMLKKAEADFEILQKKDQNIYALSQLCQDRLSDQAGCMFVKLIDGQTEPIERSETHYRQTHNLVNTKTLEYFYNLFAERRLKIAFRIGSGLPWVHLLTPAFTEFYRNHSEFAFIPACIQNRLFAQQGSVQNKLLQIIEQDDVDNFIQWKERSEIKNTVSSLQINDTRLIDLVLASNSLKILKYLILTESYSEITDNLERSMGYAILGGNPEIIHLIEEYAGNLSKNIAQSAAIWAFIFQRYDIMNYLLDHFLKGKSIDKLLKSSHRFPQFEKLSSNDIEILGQMDQAGENINLDLIKKAD